MFKTQKRRRIHKKRRTLKGSGNPSSRTLLRKRNHLNAMYGAPIEAVGVGLSSGNKNALTLDKIRKNVNKRANIKTAIGTGAKTYKITNISKVPINERHNYVNLLGNSEFKTYHNVHGTI